MRLLLALGLRPTQIVLGRLADIGGVPPCCWCRRSLPRLPLPTRFETEIAIAKASG